MNWTEEDEVRANQEGWSFITGIIQRLTTPCVFTSLSAVHAHIRSNAQTSEWHQYVYEHIPWLPTDQDAARKEGWNIISDKPIRVGSKFSTVEQVLEHIKQEARAGKVLHRKALTTMTKYKLLNENRSWQQSK